MRSLCLYVCGVFTLTGCIVPELDNYPADKSKGSGTLVIGEDATVSSGGGGGPCTADTLYDSVYLTGAGSSSNYTGQCTVSGSVTVSPYAVAAQIDQLQQIQSISGSLQLDVPTFAAALGLPALTSIGGSLQISGQSNQQTLDLPALQHLNLLSVQNAAYITDLSAPALSVQVQTVVLSANPELQHVAIGATQITQAVTVSNNAKLTTLGLANLQAVNQLFITDNATLTTINLPVTAVVVGQWSICRNPQLDPAWLAAWKVQHPTGSQPCN
jgi:hypothetical protein